MANRGQFVYTAADYSITLKAGLSYLLEGAVPTPLNKRTKKGVIIEAISWGNKLESEFIHSVGSKYAQALKTNGYTVSGKLDMEFGELEAFLRACEVSSITQIEGSIAVVALDGNLNVLLDNVVFTSDDVNIKSKDKRTLVSINFDALIYEAAKDRAITANAD